MKISDVTMEDLISQPLTWDDFDDNRRDASNIKRLIENDSEALAKIRFLDQVENGDLLDKDTFSKLDFYEVEFTEYARLYLAEGQYSPDGALRGKEVDYLKDYSGLKLLIQDISDPLGNSGLFALYLKDYEFGFIEPLGVCVYPFDFTDESWVQYREDPEGFLREHVLLAFELEFWEDDFDLKKEFFDYYHNLSDVHDPMISKRADLEGLLSAKETSERLGVSIPRVMKMVEEKSIDGYRFGGKLLITQSSVEERLRYIEEHGKPTRGKAPEDKKTEESKRRKRMLNWEVQKMTKTTNEMIEACYKGGVSIFKSELDQSYVKNRIVEETGMNPASASYYLSAVVALLSDGEIKRDINQTAVDFYLGKIKDDFGEGALRTAAEVCRRRYEETKKLGKTCIYYKSKAEEHLKKLR